MRTSRAADDYLMFPKSASDTRHGELTRELTAFFGDQLYVLEDDEEGFGLLFWRAPLSSEQIEKYKVNPIVGSDII